MDERLTAYRSPNGKFRVNLSGGNFAVAEELKEGSLLTLFNSHGEVLDQSKYSGDAEESIRRYFGKEIDIEDVDEYETVRVDAVCPRCGGSNIKRELDLVDTKKLSNVPIVPIYICMSCKQGLYSLTKEYLRKVVEQNINLFSESELRERDADEDAFINELNEYIIRIFASKKLMRIEIKE